MRTPRAILAVFIFLAGCASQTFPPDSAPAYLVLRDGTEFYRFGPLQATPPDAILPKNTPVKLLRREFGFSLVQDPSFQTGYVANENLIEDSSPPITEDLPIVSAPEVSPPIIPDEDRPLPDMIVDDEPLPLPDLESDLPDHPAP